MKTLQKVESNILKAFTSHNPFNGLDINIDRLTGTIVIIETGEKWTIEEIAHELDVGLETAIKFFKWITKGGPIKSITLCDDLD